MGRKSEVPEEYRQAAESLLFIKNRYLILILLSTLHRKKIPSNNKAAADLALA